MSVDRQKRLFDACMDAASDDERERLLESCDDPELEQQVRDLLRMHADVGDSDSLAYALPEFPRLASPHQVGTYRILDRLGEGAIGEVFLAEQQAPVRRRVALKILKFGLATREVIGRFELERQALAVLTHPNIARIYDAGTTPDGRPYFAMEYVPGIPLTRYADQRRLGVDARLAMFSQVCAGVQHAHLRGIIHRDLKPSNILVTEVDGAPVPKIIDFGIAKATTTAAADADVYTRHGHLLGTPDYMSPEQAQLSPLDVDARTDVYSLGILLFELLTGSRPYEVTRDALNPAILLNDILACETRRPSEVAGKSPQAVAHAERCGLTPGALAARLRGDLDWIVLKALEKDRQRRYDSPAAFAADLQRHEDDEPVLAGPPSTLYRVGKFARRHRFAVGMLGTAFIAALVFGSAMAWFAQKAAAERDRANREAQVARRVTGFAAGIFELANPARTGSSDISARELLDAGVRRLRAQGEAQRPDVRAALLEAAGNAYVGLGAYDEASTLLDSAVSVREQYRNDDPTAYAQALLSQAVLKRERGDLDRATMLARDAERVLQNAGNRAEVHALHVVRLDLAEILRRRTELGEAAALAERTLAETTMAKGEEATVRARALMVLGRIRAAQGGLPEAERLLRESLAMYVQREGPLGEMTLEAKNGLADTLVIMGQPSRAEPLLRELVEDVRRVYGGEHAEMGIVLNNLGNALSDIPEKYAEAGDAYLAAAAITRRTRGELHPETATTYNNLGALYLKTHEWARADEAFQRAIEIRISAFGPDHPHTAQAQRSRAEALGRLGHLGEAEQLLRTSIATYERSLGTQHWRTANARLYLGWVLAREGQATEAARVMNEAFRSLAQALGNDHPRVVVGKDLMVEAGVAR